MGNNYLEVNVLNSHWRVVVSWGTPREIRTITKQYGYPKHNVKSAMATARGVCFSSRDCYPVVALPCYPRTPEEIGALAHEAVHAINYIFKTIGEKSRDEVFCHSVEAVVRETLENPPVEPEPAPKRPRGRPKKVVDTPV